MKIWHCVSHVTPGITATAWISLTKCLMSQELIGSVGHVVPLPSKSICVVLLYCNQCSVGV